MSYETTCWNGCTYELYSRCRTECINLKYGVTNCDDYCAPISTIPPPFPTTLNPATSVINPTTITKTTTQKVTTMTPYPINQQCFDHCTSYCPVKNSTCINDCNVECENQEQYLANCNSKCEETKSNSNECWNTCTTHIYNNCKTDCTYRENGIENCDDYCAPISTIPPPSSVTTPSSVTAKPSPDYLKELIEIFIYLFVFEKIYDHWEEHHNPSSSFQINSNMILIMLLTIFIRKMLK